MLNAEEVNNVSHTCNPFPQHTAQTWTQISKAFVSEVMVLQGGAMEMKEILTYTSLSVKERPVLLKL